MGGRINDGIGSLRDDGIQGTGDEPFIYKQKKILILSIFVKDSKVLKFMPNQHRELSFELFF